MWIASAITPLPVPVSPSSKTVASDAAIRGRTENRRRIAKLQPTARPNDSASPTGSLSLRPAAAGTSVITVTVDDAQAVNHSVTRTFTVTAAPHRAPLSAATARAVAKDVVLPDGVTVRAASYNIHGGLESGPEAIGAMLALWMRFRLDALDASDGRWIPKGIKVPMVTANTMLLAFVPIGVFAQWAVWAARRNARSQTALALALVAVIGVAIINAQAFIIGKRNGWSPAYAHQASVIVGLLGLAYVLRLGVTALLSAVGSSNPVIIFGLSGIVYLPITILLVHRVPAVVGLRGEELRHYYHAGMRVLGRS